MSWQAICDSLFGKNHDVRAEGEVLRAREQMRRLAALTIRNFPDRNVEGAELFWRSIRRDQPIQDPWGTDYHLDGEAGVGEKKFYWRSAGPDRSFGTRDDLAVEVPYARPQEVSSELKTEDLHSDRPPSLNAR